MRRREFLSIPATSLGGALLYSLAGEPVRLEAGSNDEIKIPLRFFTAVEAGKVVAATARIIPSDSTGPGAKEANVVVYIDRQLAGPYGRDRYRYTKGPWRDSVPEHGYQRKETPREIYRSGLALLPDNFAGSPPDLQDELLVKIEKSYFFQMLRTHTIEGFLCDPLHGGNAGMIGWQLVGYPGPLMSYRDVIEQHGVPFRPKPRSLSQILGRDVQGWEDEVNPAEIVK